MVKHLGLLQWIIHVSVVVHRSGDEVQAGLAQDVREDIYNTKEIQRDEDVTVKPCRVYR